MDEDGKGYLYSSEPARRLHVWHFCVDNEYIGDYDPSDWQNSLIKRPAAKSESPVADLPEHNDVKAPSYYVNTPFGMELKKSPATTILTADLHLSTLSATAKRFTAA